MKTKRYFTFTVMIIVLSFGIPAIADLSFYTDRSAWEAEVGGDIETENFDSVTPYFLTEGVNNTGLIGIELVNISQTNAYNSIDDGLFPLDIDGTPFFRGGCLHADPDAIINLVLPSPVSAFGVDVTSIYSYDGLTLQVNGLQYDLEQWSPAGDDTGFLGFISTSPFSTITLFDPVTDAWRLGESFGLDNVSFAVPEPITLSFLGLGSSILLKRRRK